jgi:hypothetical protein
MSPNQHHATVTDCHHDDIQLLRLTAFIIQLELLEDRLLFYFPRAGGFIIRLDVKNMLEFPSLNLLSL